MFQENTRKGGANMRRLGVLDWIALVLIIIGGINWGLIGLFDFNLVAAIFGATVITTIVYLLVGLAALYAIYTVSRTTPTDVRP
jgi:uncharacterized protein